MKLQITLSIFFLFFFLFGKIAIAKEQFFWDYPLKPGMEEWGTLSSSVPRITLLEEFTSSTGAHHTNATLSLRNVLAENDLQGGYYTLIKYQMFFPTPGDPYYTLEGGERRIFYEANSVPLLHIDGQDNIYTPSFTHDDLVNAQNIPSFIKVAGNFSVVGQAVFASINITPTIDINDGDDLKLYIAIVEKKTYNNIMGSGLPEFDQVMKKFMPNANGIVLGNLTANQTVTFEQTWKFQGNYRCPFNAYEANIINQDIEHSVENFDNLEVVAWCKTAVQKKFITHVLQLRIALQQLLSILML